MASKKEPSCKTLWYTYDPDATYTYNTKHGTVYPENKFPTGLNGRIYKRTRFIDWEPIPEDIIIRHYGSQIIVNFSALFPNDVVDKSYQVFQLRAKRVDLQNFICEQINFFTALYDDDNDLLSSMLVAKYITDSERYTIATFDEYYIQLYNILFPKRTMDKIKKMVEENDVGDDIIGLFPPDFLKDMFIISFMIKIMHIFIEHFILSTGNTPKDRYEYFAKVYKHAMDQLNPNMYAVLYEYVYKSVTQSISSNINVYDMQAINGVTAPTTTQFVLRKTLMCDGLIKLTFASSWDKINKRPTFSCVGLIKAIIMHASLLIRKQQLRYTLVNVNDQSQLLQENITSSTPISIIRSFNPGAFECTIKDLNAIIAHIAIKIDTSPVDFYLEHLPEMNDLSKILITLILYNKFHSSLSIDVLNKRQKYLLLLYVRSIIMKIYGISEEYSTGDYLINILMGKTTTSTTKNLTNKDMNSIKKYIKLNNLKQYLLSEQTVNVFLENIMHCVMSTYTIVNHNDPTLLDVQLVYESGNMTLKLLDMIVEIFEYIKSEGEI